MPVLCSNLQSKPWGCKESVDEWNDISPSRDSQRTILSTSVREARPWSDKAPYRWTEVVLHINNDESGLEGHVDETWQGRNREEKSTDAGESEWTRVTARRKGEEVLRVEGLRSRGYRLPDNVHVGSGVRRPRLEYLGRG